jgi:predicted nucleotidyltransferase
MQIDYQKDDDLKEMVLKLQNHFKPLKVYLFGSRASNTASPDSDYDLALIVKKSNLNRAERELEARKVLKDRKVPVDIFIYTEKEFEDWKNEFSSIPYTISSEGVELDFV